MNMDEWCVLSDSHWTHNYKHFWYFYYLLFYVLDVLGRHIKHSFAMDTDCHFWIESLVKHVSWCEKFFKYWMSLWDAQITEESISSVQTLHNCQSTLFSKQKGLKLFDSENPEYDQASLAKQIRKLVQGCKQTQLFTIALIEWTPFYPKKRAISRRLTVLMGDTLFQIPSDCHRLASSCLRVTKSPFLHPLLLRFVSDPSRRGCAHVMITFQNFKLWRNDGLSWTK